jgi:hypothetical protein
VDVKFRRFEDYRAHSRIVHGVYLQNEAPPRQTAQFTSRGRPFHRLQSRRPQNSLNMRQQDMNNLGALITNAVKEGMACFTIFILNI